MHYCITAEPRAHNAQGHQSACRQGSGKTSCCDFLRGQIRAGARRHRSNKRPPGVAENNRLHRRSRQARNSHSSRHCDCEHQRASADELPQPLQRAKRLLWPHAAREWRDVWVGCCWWLLGEGSTRGGSIGRGSTRGGSIGSRLHFFVLKRWNLNWWNERANPLPETTYTTLRVHGCIDIFWKDLETI